MVSGPPKAPGLGRQRRLCIRCPVVDAVTSGISMTCRTTTVRKAGSRTLTCGLSAVRSTTGGMLPVMILSFGYLILRRVLQLVILLARGDRANAVEVLVLWHQVAGATPPGTPAGPGAG